MVRVMLKSKIHRATITQANLAYEGSLTIDRELMEAADILPYEMVYVYNISNGERFETYAMAGAPGSGIICLNGAAARKGAVGDLVIVTTFATYQPEELPQHAPKIVLVDARNRRRPAAQPQ